MIIGAYVDQAAPDHPAGAEWSLHDTMAGLARAGHDCRVVAEHGIFRGYETGVRVFSQPSHDELAQHFAECDVMLTQLAAVPYAQQLAVEHQVPLVHLVHSGAQLENLGVMPGAAALVVFNAQHVADACSWWWPGDTMILHPVIDAERVTAPRGGAHVTLVNLSHEKGAARFLAVADELPRRTFLGVMGAYDTQVITTHGIPGHGAEPRPAAVPHNLIVSPPQRDVAGQVFAHTRVLLVLSRHETYGRVAIEAMHTGIPVIATTSPGLAEACGDAARYIDITATARSVARLIDATYDNDWHEWHAAALDQAQYARERTSGELHDFERRLVAIAAAKPRMSMTTEPARV